MTIQGKLRRIKRRAYVRVGRKLQKLHWRWLQFRYNRVRDLEKYVPTHGWLFFPHTTFFQLFCAYTILRLLWVWPFAWNEGPTLVVKELLIWDIPLAFLAYKGALLCYKYLMRTGTPIPHVGFNWGDKSGNLSWSLMVDWHISYPANNREHDYYLHLHRENGPANIDIRNGKVVFTSWNYRNEAHRFDGYAIMADEPGDHWGRGKRKQNAYYILGTKLTKSQFNKYVKDQPHVNVMATMFIKANRFYRGDKCRKNKFRQAIVRWLRDHGHGQVAKTIIKSLAACNRLRR